MKTYIVTDLQKDFYSPDGRLSVNGAETLPSKVAENVKLYDAVIFTLDWHPVDHCSFTSRGGSWPVHCVQYTDGASLPLEVVEAVRGLEVMHYFKGQDPLREEYGAFSDIPEDQMSALERSAEIVICGLCGDYCVGETIKNLVKLGFGGKLAVDLGCTGSIDDGSVLRSIIEEYKLKTI